MLSKFYLALAATSAAVAFAAPASAAVVLHSTFETSPGNPSAGTYVTVPTADGWTGGPNGIELQNNIAGAPAADGGNVFVELDTTANSYMTHLLNPGTYTVSFEYSARPGVPASSNGIQVLIGGTSLTSVAFDGGASTNWGSIATGSFTINAPTLLTFKAIGTSDSLGGYLDNITVSSIPEPATWAMMIGGFSLIGFSMRRRTRIPTSLA